MTVRALRFIGSAALGVVLALLVSGHAKALDQIQVKVTDWSSDNGHAYVGVQATGQWAPPSETGKQVKTEFWSEWQNMGTPSPYCNAWWVFVHRTSDGSTVNFDSPAALVTCGPEAVIGVNPAGFADMNLYLAVAVEPVSAPARSERTVRAELTTGWRSYLGKAISAYVVPSSVHVDRWTVDFGDGTRRTFPGDGSDRLATTHRYDAGTFDVIVSAHVSGQAYGAFFTPDGVPYEQVVPFALDISNRATGVAALPIEYVPPVVTVGASPSGTLPDGTLVAPDTAGHAALWWPRGLHCALYVRPIIETEGVMRSGGVVIGGATTRLVSYRYEPGINDAADATPAGTNTAGTPLAIQWNTPLSDQQAYPVHLVLTLETTYADGTVRDIEVTGDVAVTVIYAAVSH
jgi:hypothetical protein